MDTEALLSQLNINQLTDNIFNTRRITRRDQRLLMYLLSSYRLGEQEQNLINRIYEMLNKGLLRVVDWNYLGISLLISLIFITI